VEQLRRRRYSQKYHKTLKEGVNKKKKPKGIQEQEKVEAIPTPEEEISKIQHLEIKPQTKLVGEEIGIVEQNIDIEPLVSM
jgi:hypothetical protein